jgi:hypothetical protein
MLSALGGILQETSYFGPVCIDSFLYLDSEGLHWHRVSEINARWSMGRLAHQLRLKLSPHRFLTLGFLDIKSALASKNVILLGDPATASTRVPFVKI